MNHHEAGLSDLLHHAMTAESAGDPGVTGEMLSAAGAFPTAEDFRCFACGRATSGAFRCGSCNRNLCRKCRETHVCNVAAANAKARARVNLKSFIDRLDRKNGFPPTRWPGEDCK